MTFEFPRPNLPIAEGGTAPANRSWLQWLRNLASFLFSHDHASGSGAQIDHTTLANLDSTTYSHVTAAHKTDLTDGGETSLHTHDHGALNGKADDDHSQYPLSIGRAGGQTLIGGTASGDYLTLKSSSNATKGSVIFGNAAATVYDEVNERLGVNVASPSYTLDVGGTIRTIGDIIVPKTSGVGIKVDTASPTFGWADLLGQVHARGTGATDPSWATYQVGIKQFQFSVNDEIWNEFHIPHDYLPGSNIYIHAHWSHNATTVTGGTVTWGFEFTYAKGHNQAAFFTPITPTKSGNASTVQYRHMIHEIAISSASPGALEMNTSLLEVDGLILVRTYLSANNMTVSSGLAPEPFLHYVDLHYQTTNIGTKNKIPNFYS